MSHRRAMQISVIARRTGHNRTTVHNYIQQGLALSKFRLRAARAGALGDFRGYLQERPPVQSVRNGSRLLREFRALGYQGGKTSFHDYLRRIRPPLMAAIDPEFSFLRLPHRPQTHISQLIKHAALYYTIWPPQFSVTVWPIVGNAAAVARTVGPLDSALTIGLVVTEFTHVSQLGTWVAGARKRPIAASRAGAVLPVPLVCLATGPSQPPLPMSDTVKPLADVGATIVENHRARTRVPAILEAAFEAVWRRGGPALC